MSTTTYTPLVRRHPLAAGPSPAALWVLAEVCWAVQKPAIVVIVLWGAHTLSDRGLTNTTVVAIIAAQAAVLALFYAQRRLHHAARFRTPGALGYTTPKDPQDSARLLAPAWVVSIISHALTVVTAVWVLSWPTASDRFVAAGADTTTGQVFAGWVMIVAMTGVALAMARSFHDALSTRSWTALVPMLITVTGQVALYLVVRSAADAATLHTVSEIGPTITVLLLVIWVARRLISGMTKANRLIMYPSTTDELATTALTWWKGAATLEDRRRYVPLIKASAITLGVLLLVVLLW